MSHPDNASAHPAYAVKIPATAVGPRNSNSKLRLLRRVTVAFPGISGGGLPTVAYDE